MARPRLLIEDWLPTVATGVECMRERGSASALAPTTFLHVWWARRPLTASRAVVLASLLPADFDREIFEKLLGFYAPGDIVVANQDLLQYARSVGQRINNPHGPRAFKNHIDQTIYTQAHDAATALWGTMPTVIDPMSGGGSIPLEAVRLGFPTLANEYNPVACTVLEATLDYPVRFGAKLGQRARHWADVLVERFNDRMSEFFPHPTSAQRHTYLFARTVPCPDTGHPTPIVPDWYVCKAKGKVPVVAVPVVDRVNGTWSVSLREVGNEPGQLPEAEVPARTYSGGKGVSLFSGQQIAADWIKAKAQAGEMQSQLYCVVVKTPQGFAYEPPHPEDLAALDHASEALDAVRERWERTGIIPVEMYPEVSTDHRPRTYGMPRWADLFSPRQLLAMGTLVEELRNLRHEICAAEGDDLGEAVVHLLALGADKFADYNCISCCWENTRIVSKHIFQRHDFAFRPTHSEMAPCNAGSGLAWAFDNVLSAWEDIEKLPRSDQARPATLTKGSATNLSDLKDGSVQAVVVDPPYADNVQYSELADFFYVWLKRTQGHRRPNWFASELCDNAQEAVTNDARFRKSNRTVAEAKQLAGEHYQKLMQDVFSEAHRVLVEDGVLTVMFMHKKQEAWESLFESLIAAGFQITAAWPVRTDNPQALNIANKNSAQSTVMLVCRKRAGAAVGIWDPAFGERIRVAARTAAAELEAAGLVAIDQLVGTFGRAMAVYSEYAVVRRDTGGTVGVAAALDQAAVAVTDWRIARLMRRGMAGLGPEARFVLLWWDVLAAAKVGFNEAMLLSRAVGRDVETLKEAGLIEKKSSDVIMLPAASRRRAQALAGAGGAVAFDTQIHPRDPAYRTALDACQALALAWLEAEEAGASGSGLGVCRSMAQQHGWTAEDEVARLMQALVEAAPPALRQEGQAAAKAYPEFRAWHALLAPLFGLEAPDWTVRPPAQAALDFGEGDDDEDEEEDSTRGEGWGHDPEDEDDEED